MIPDVTVTAGGRVYRGETYYGRVRRTLWSRGRTWEALDVDDHPIDLPGRNMAFPTAQKAVEVLVEVSR